MAFQYPPLRMVSAQDTQAGTGGRAFFVAGHEPPRERFEEMLTGPDSLKEYFEVRGCLVDTQHLLEELAAACPRTTVAGLAREAGGCAAQQILRFDEMLRLCFDAEPPARRAAPAGNPPPRPAHPTAAPSPHSWR